MKQANYGAGFAGAATAFHLVRMGAKGVLILEREGEVGRNSSGLNAAMVVQTGSDEAMEAVARRGAQFIRKPPAGWPGSLGFSPIGSLYLASGEALKGREAAAGRARAAGVEAEVRTRAWAAERVP
ncbi:MAG: FAD-dependent oxidoreductase, partial [Candidatus Binatia bacterium]